MPIVSFQSMMRDAEKRGYGVGYFECWNLESLLAIADAAERVCSPVILGFSGIYLPHARRAVRDQLGVYAAMGHDVCRSLSVPACLLFNESPHKDWVLDAIGLGFGLVMFSDDRLDTAEMQRETAMVVEAARQKSIAVEGEMTPLPGVHGELSGPPNVRTLTDPATAHEFVENTGVDALSVNVGQVHLHGRDEVRLDLSRVKDLADAVRVPLVLHGASSVNRDDIRGAIELGIRKINVGSALKQAYLNALTKACAELSDDANPYETIGSGLLDDVLVAGRLAMQTVVEDYLHLFSSAGKSASE